MFVYTRTIAIKVNKMDAVLTRIVHHVIFVRTRRILIIIDMFIPIMVLVAMYAGVAVVVAAAVTIVAVVFVVVVTTPSATFYVLARAGVDVVGNVAVILSVIALTVSSTVVPNMLQKPVV